MAADEWKIPLTEIAKNTFNPIRDIVDKLKPPAATPEKPLIPLSIGDPCFFGNLDVPSVALDAITDKLKSKKYNGYGPSTGLVEAKEAIARRYTTPEAPLSAADVVVASGCSGAITIAVAALASPGDNILTPRPGFGLYQTVANHYGIEARQYPLLPERSWEVDLKELEALVDSRTRAIVINNPSNPAGSNYSREHLLDILALAERHRLPILADEIYADMVFKGHKFHAMADLTTEVPILTVGGIAKQYVVPGWRLGWILIHDKKGRFKNVREACMSLSQVTLGACTVIQSIVPDLLEKTPAAYYSELMDKLEANARFLCKRLSGVPGLRVIEPQGAMYVMIGLELDKFRAFEDDTDFAVKLLNEELVYVLPGKCFQAPGFFRIVFCAPLDILEQACDRIERFCRAHLKDAAASL